MLEGVGVLLIEDDDGDALLVADLLEDGASEVGLTRARSLHQALAELTGEVDCILLDLGLPDAFGLEGLGRLRAAAPDLAVVVLTGLDDEAAGAAAVDAGAQDYLVKGKIDGGLLARAIRYAIGRRQAEDAQHQLRIAEIRADENARLERGLMARPIVLDPSIWMASRYRAGRHRALLGGDFFDVVQTPDGVLHAMVGDVCGHGPDEAALGASLRIAWRALILSGAATDAVLDTLQVVLEHERQVPGTFATLCTLEVDPTRRSVRVRRAGHPPPVLIDGTSVIPWPADSGGPPIAAFDYTGWPAARYELPPSWSILLYTDGLIEGRVDAGPDRLGEDGLHRLIVDHLDRLPDWRADPDGLLRQLIERATDLNGDELSDDVAMVLVGTEDDRSGPNGGR
ncbi:MAG: hypothetical protein QOE44_1806 [Solirubrobacteraceae bacterium]|nr:hypothetical protein [Solirubrobacteraceae bacterium]